LVLPGSDARQAVWRTGTGRVRPTLGTGQRGGRFPQEELQQRKNQKNPGRQFHPCTERGMEMKTALARKLAPALFLALCALPAASQAKNWPTGPVKIVVPFTAGGSTDVVS